VLYVDYNLLVLSRHALEYWSTSRWFYTTWFQYLQNITGRFGYPRAPCS
jgi:hypothetical protein